MGVCPALWPIHPVGLRGLWPGDELMTEFLNDSSSPGGAGALRSRSKSLRELSSSSAGASPSQHGTSAKSVATPGPRAVQEVIKIEDDDSPPPELQA